MSEDPRITALRGALAADPANGVLIGLLGDLLADLGRRAESLEAFLQADGRGALSAAQRALAAQLAIDLGDLEVAGRLVDGAASGDPALGPVRDRLRQLLADADLARRPADGELDALRSAAAEHPVERPRAEREEIHFAQVAGNEEPKQAIERAIILPFTRPDLYASYGRRAGAGLLLYGPPGCGKTLLARATAGECGVPFRQIRIEEILSPYMGESERALHDAFEQARAAAPCVVFIDEIDAFAFSRSRRAGADGRALVTVLLQELDGLDSANDGMLVLAASNTPWDIDDALLRPGRFDRQLFVPPPDLEARRFLLSLALAGRPHEVGDVVPVAEATALFSGADLTHLVESAVDLAIEEAINSGTTIPVSDDHLRRALSRARPTTAEWLLSARNHAEFANTAGRYQDVIDFLSRREVKRALT
ncbi:MAG: 26S protease regulatory subunit [Thermoleophilia bacterium]